MENHYILSPRKNDNDQENTSSERSRSPTLAQLNLLSRSPSNESTLPVSHFHADLTSLTDTGNIQQTTCGLLSMNDWEKTSTECDTSLTLDQQDLLFSPLFNQTLLSQTYSSITLAPDNNQVLDTLQETDLFFSDFHQTNPQTPNPLTESDNTMSELLDITQPQDQPEKESPRKKRKMDNLSQPKILLYPFGYKSSDPTDKILTIVSKPAVLGYPDNEQPSTSGSNTSTSILRKKTPSSKSPVDASPIPSLPDIDLTVTIPEVTSPLSEKQKFLLSQINKKELFEIKEHPSIRKAEYRKANTAFLPSNLRQLIDTFIPTPYETANLKKLMLRIMSHYSDWFIKEENMTFIPNNNIDSTTLELACLVQRALNTARRKNYREKRQNPVTS